ncbi:MAG: helix-turn-helix domain-containing protein [Chthonomonadales bacterium]
MGAKLSLREAAEYLGVSYNQTIRHVRNGNLKAVKANGVWVLEAEDVRDFVAPPEGRPRMTIPVVVVHVVKLDGDKWTLCNRSTDKINETVTVEYAGHPLGEQERLCKKCLIKI